jgi:hypothetical protein
MISFGAETAFTVGVGTSLDNVFATLLIRFISRGTL